MFALHLCRWMGWGGEINNLHGYVNDVFSLMFLHHVLYFHVRNAYAHIVTHAADWVFRLEAGIFCSFLVHYWWCISSATDKAGCTVSNPPVIVPFLVWHHQSEPYQFWVAQWWSYQKSDTMFLDQTTLVYYMVNGPVFVQGCYFIAVSAGFILKIHNFSFCSIN